MGPRFRRRGRTDDEIGRYPCLLVCRASKATSAANTFMFDTEGASSHCLSSPVRRHLRESRGKKGAYEAEGGCCSYMSELTIISSQGTQ